MHIIQIAQRTWQNPIHQNETGDSKSGSLTSNPVSWPSPSNMTQIKSTLYFKLLSPHYSTLHTSSMLHCGMWQGISFIQMISCHLYRIPYILAALVNDSNLLFAFAIKMHSLQSLCFRYQEVVRQHFYVLLLSWTNSMMYLPSYKFFIICTLQLRITRLNPTLHIEIGFMGHWIFFMGLIFCHPLIYGPL